MDKLVSEETNVHYIKYLWKFNFYKKIKKIVIQMAKWTKADS